MKSELEASSSLCHTSSVSSFSILSLSVISSDLRWWKAFLKRVTKLEHSWWLQLLTLFSETTSKEWVFWALYWFILWLSYLTQIDASWTLLDAIHLSRRFLIILGARSFDSEATTTTICELAVLSLLESWTLINDVNQFVFHGFWLELFCLDVKLNALLRVLVESIVVLIVHLSALVGLNHRCYGTSDSIEFSV